MKELTKEEMYSIDAGGFGGFIIGYMFGAIVGMVGGGIMAATGSSQEDVSAFVMSSLATGGGIGALFTGPA